MVMPTMQSLLFLNHPGMIQGIKAPAPMAGRPAPTPAAPMNISGGGSMGNMLNNMLSNGAIGGLMGIGR